jgi:hypothetical protein
MKPILIPAFAGLLIGASPAMAAGEDHAGPEEVIAKVRSAAALLAERGPAGLDTLRDATSPYSWKDTYVFVVDCNADEVMANPAFPSRQGGDIKQHTDYDGKQYGHALCETATRPGGGWIEYVWLKPGGDVPLRKISYVMSVDGQPYQLGAGIYDETVTLEELAVLSADTK